VKKWIFFSWIESKPPLEYERWLSEKNFLAQQILQQLLLPISDPSVAQNAFYQSKNDFSAQDLQG